MSTLVIDFNPVHRRENNAESEAHLQQNRGAFNAQCLTVLKRLAAGEQLSMKEAINSGIGDLRRRVKDLKDHYQIPIQAVWVNSKEGRYKLYSIAPEHRAAALLKIMQQATLLPTQK